MAGLNTIFAAFAAVGLLGAGIAAGALVGPRLASGSDSAAQASTTSFTGVTPLYFEDPAGDASDAIAEAIVGGTVCAIVHEAGAHCPDGGSPLADEAPHFDIVGVSLAEPDEDHVLLTLSIAELTEDLDALAPAPGTHRMAAYSVCIAYDDACTHAAYLFAMRHGDETHLEANFDAYVGECNGWSWCSWPIPVDVVYGAPAVITFTIPKAWATYGASREVHHLEAFTGWGDQLTAFPMWHGGWTLHTPAYHLHDHTPTTGFYGLADVTDALPAEVTLAPARTAPVVAADVPLAYGLGGATHADGSTYDRSELDLVGLDIHDEDGGIAVVVALQEAAAQPTYDFDYAIVLGFEGQRPLELGFRQEHGASMGYAGICIMETCQESRTHEVAAEFIPGAPAFIVIHVPAEVLHDLAVLEPGATSTLASVASMATEGSQYFGDYEGAVYGDVHHAFMADFIGASMPFVLGSGHRAPLEAFAAAEHEH